MKYPSAFLAFFSLLVVSCGGSEPDITGQITKAGSKKGSDTPVTSIDVMLVEGAVLDILAALRAEWEEGLGTDVAREMLSRLRERRADLQVVQVELRDSVEKIPSLARSVEGEDVGGCEAVARKSVDVAEKELALILFSLLRSVPEMRDDDSSVSEIIEKLRQVGAEQVEAAGRDVVDGYVEASLRSESRTIYQSIGGGGDGGRSRSSGSRRSGSRRSGDSSVASGGRGVPSNDRLCWEMTNRGDLNVTSLHLFLRFNGQRIPSEIAEAFWALPAEWDFEEFGSGIVFRNLSSGSSPKHISSVVSLRARYLWGRICSRMQPNMA